MVETVMYLDRILNLKYIGEYKWYVNIVCGFKLCW
jgi:hypothetical protein